MPALSVNSAATHTGAMVPLQCQMATERTLTTTHSRDGCTVAGDSPTQGNGTDCVFLFPVYSVA